MMKLFPRNKKRPEKELERPSRQDDNRSSEGQEVSVVVEKKAHRFEEYGLFILHNLPHDQANALEWVI